MNPATQRAAAFRARCNDLASALARLADLRGFADSAEAGVKAKREILRAIEHKKSDKLRNWSYETRTIRPWRRMAQVPPVNWATMLVRLKQNEQAAGRLRGTKRFDREAGIKKDASGATFDQLSPVESRAVQLLRGAKRKPKKNTIEDRAIRLANAVRTDWFTATKKGGRPAGTSSQNIKIVDLRYEVPLSIAEVVAIAKPLIEEFAGTTLKASVSDAGSETVSEIKSPTFAALVAAVRIVLPDCPPKSILSITAREKRKARAAKRAGI